jgi:uncharacterized membrane protein
MRTMDRDRTLLTVLGVLVLVALVALMLGGGMMGRGTMWGYGGATHMGGWSWGPGMAFGSLGMLALFGALIAGGFVLFHWAADHSGAGWGAGAEDPQAILRRRYAAGEIDQATYERMQRELAV